MFKEVDPARDCAITPASLLAHIGCPCTPSQLSALLAQLVPARQDPALVSYI
jgi:hypothetical protein